MGMDTIDYMILEPRREDKARLKIGFALMIVFLTQFVLLCVNKKVGIFPRLTADGELLFLMFILCASFAYVTAYSFQLANTHYIIDKRGITRVFLKKNFGCILWTEMKYIGVCMEHTDARMGNSSRPRKIMLFSMRPFSDYDRYHAVIGRQLEAKTAFVIKYIDDETYEKILEFSGGERNIE